jgi:hypothetical protein
VTKSETIPQRPLLSHKNMFRTAIRAARPIVARSTFKPAPKVSLRAIHASASVASGGPAPPSLYGAGSKPGEVPTDVDQATGLERLQLLGELEGVEIFDEKPLPSDRIGTKANPVLVPSYVRVPLSNLCFVLTCFSIRMLSVLSGARAFLLTPTMFIGSTSLRKSKHAAQNVALVKPMHKSSP